MLNDVSILDLFWLILKFLAALGLVALIGVVLYLIWLAAKRAISAVWRVAFGRDASVTATVCAVLAVVVGLCGMVVFLHDKMGLSP